MLFYFKTLWYLHILNTSKCMLVNNYNKIQTDFISFKQMFGDQYHSGQHP
jgi:hypothetical protein